MLSNRTQWLTMASLLCMTVPSLFFALWIVVYNSVATHPERVELFYSYLPAILHERYTVSILGVVLCALAITISISSLKSAPSLWKGLNMGIIVLSALLLVFNLWGMM
jgi:hypothetical protein